jgi:hypothetical protein
MKPLTLHHLASSLHRFIVADTDVNAKTTIFFDFAREVTAI